MTVPRLRWYHHVPPARAFLQCEGGQHVVEWRRGKFVLHDHELTAERALLVLGGQPSPCLQALRMWREQFGMPPEYFEHLQSWLGANAALAPQEMALPRDMSMVLSWERAWHRSVYLSDKHGKLITAWVQERGLPLFRQHLNTIRARFGSRVISGARVRAVSAREEPKVDGRLDSVGIRGEVSLSSDWLVTVWARGIALVGPAFVVAVTADSFHDPAVLAVRWEQADDGNVAPAIHPATLSRDVDGAWQLRWDDEAGPVS